MARPYSPPNVTVSEVVDPTVAPLIAPPALLAIVGHSNGFVTRRQIVTFSKPTTAVNGTQSSPSTLTVDSTANFDSSGTIKVGSTEATYTGKTATTFTGVTGLSGSISDNTAVSQNKKIPLNVPNGSKVTEITKVEDAAYDSDAVYVSGDDYDAVISSVAQSTTNNAATIQRDDEGNIPQGSASDYEYSVYVTFKYIPEDYWQPIRLTNYSEVVERFGEALTNPDVTGETVEINSAITYGAEIAFENGATEVVCQPLFAGNGSQPANDTNPSDWQNTLQALRVVPDVNLIVPVPLTSTNQFNIMQKVQDHINYMGTEEQQQIIGVFGVDSVSAVVTAETVRLQAATLAARFGGELAQNMVLVSPSKFIRPYRGGGLLVGGQYMAAGIGGMIASRPVYQSLTRKPVSGFVDVAEARTKSQKNEDASVGLMVVENKNGLIQVRHALTLDTTSTATKELSVVRAKHRVIESVRDTLDTQIIGQVIADGESPIVVRSAVIGVLDQLRSERDIVTYGDVQSRLSSIDPTVVEVRFSYAPAFPVNYINVVFSLDLSGGLIATNQEVVNA
jgi:hypothetical protein